MCAAIVYPAPEKAHMCMVLDYLIRPVVFVHAIVSGRVPRVK